METIANESVEELSRKRGNPPKWFANWKIITPVILIIALAFAGIYYYQSTRFNAHITINHINVGGLTADNAIKKLASADLKNDVYIGEEQIYNGENTKTGFSNKDLSEVKKLLQKQQTFFPSSKAIDYSLVPAETDGNRNQTIKKEIEDKLTSMNKGLQAPQDAGAQLVQGNITVSKSMGGKQLDTDRLLKEYEKQAYSSEVHLKPVYIQPIKEDSQIVKNEQKTLQELLQRTVDYKVQEQVYSLKASDLIKNATISKDMKVTIDPAEIKNKLTEINNSQSTLNKDFQFKTHTGAVISVKGQGYGWAIKVDKEIPVIQEAFEKGNQSVSATNIYGNGWSNEQIGYETTANNGIGDTYAEVSIAEQHIWIYKNGQLAVTTNVVTGRHNTHEDTHTGVYYILFKRSPSILKGTSVGHGGAYSVKVDYWAPFTNDGQGFHDASWRTNWASNAYIGAGSGGCVNTPPSIMKTVYDNLSTHEPVIIY
jgi:uncharacterized protein YfcZ (UPF0381/DUF406 family)